MNNTINQIGLPAVGWLPRFCTKKFETSAGEVLNSYRCDQTAFNSTDLMNVQRQKREVRRTQLVSILG